MSPQTRAEIAELLERHGLAPIHRLGQHFLADGNITRKIMDLASVAEGDRVVEVGAGTGTLTRSLADAGAKVIAYEIDSGLRPVLEEVTSGANVDLRFEDITKVDLGEALVGEGWVMVANLPYNVGTPVVLNALRSAPNIDRFVVMIQRQVAARFTAVVGDEFYGLPSVVVGLYGAATIGFAVPSTVFYPRPKVESAVVLIERTDPSPNAERAVELAQTAFGQRRKMLRRSLESALDDPLAVLEAAGLDPTLRAENLTVDDFLRLAEAAS